MHALHQGGLCVNPQRLAHCRKRGQPSRRISGAVDTRVAVAAEVHEEQARRDRRAARVQQEVQHRKPIGVLVVYAAPHGRRDRIRAD